MGGSPIVRHEARDFVTLLGGVAAAWPTVVRAQQGERMLRIGLLMPRAADDPVGQILVAAFMQGLQDRGWTVGRNVSIDIRWGGRSRPLSRLCG
jgi:putative ABC transport system substrate-binding protein